jgi:hypothetical protein
MRALVRSQDARDRRGPPALPASLPADIQRMLALQRTAGNLSVVRMLQRSAPEAPAPPAPAPAGDLLGAFGERFADAAARIRASPAAMELVKEADAASVRFGGYSEDGPARTTTPYTVNDAVYVSKSQTDPIRAMGDFLFELNNATRSPRFDQIHKDAIAGRIDAKTFARRKIELEVEGILRMGAIWFEVKAGNPALDEYDKHFYAEEHEVFKSGAKTKEQIVDEVLQWRNINAAAMTNEQWYMERYERLLREHGVAPR